MPGLTPRVRVETPQSAGTGLPGVQGRGVSWPQPPRTPAARPESPFPCGVLNARDFFGATAEGWGGWICRGETPRPCTPGRFVPAYWGVSTGSPLGRGPSTPRRAESRLFAQESIIFVRKFSSRGREKQIFVRTFTIFAQRKFFVVRKTKFSYEDPKLLCENLVFSYKKRS